MVVYTNEEGTFWLQLNNVFFFLLLGRVTFYVFWSPKDWSLDFHGAPCCWVSLDFGPFAFSVARIG